MPSSIEHYTTTLTADAPRLPGADLTWLSTLRQRARGTFSRVGFPSARNEDWKYTRVNPIEKRVFALSHPDAGAVSAWQQHDTLNLDCYRLVFVNGVFQADASSGEQAQNGISIRSLGTTILHMPDALEPHLSRYADPAASGFSALNAACMAEGAYVYLPPGVNVDKPIVLLFVNVPSEQEICANPRILIVAGEGSNAKIIEHYCGSDEATYFTNTVSEISLGPNAQVEHYKLQSEGRKAFHISTLQVAQAHASRFISHSVSLGGRLVRNDINCSLDGEHATCELNGLYMANGRQHVDYHTRIDHKKPLGTSREYYKGVLDGHGRGVFNGRVYVHPDAQKTDAEQYNNNLLLSRNSEIDTKPQLEIFADDVKCAHGATVGQLDEDMVFYLRARGIPESAARGLLTYGFASDVIHKISLPSLRDALQKQLVDWLPNGEQVREIVT